MTTETLALARAVSMLLPLLCRGRGGLQIEARSSGGIGHEQLTLEAGSDEVPLHLLELMRYGWALRAPVVMRQSHGGPAVALPAAYALWRPTPAFSAETAWRHAIAPEAQARIADAIAASPVAPSVLIDGGPEVVALWLLDPVAALPAELDAAQALLDHMAVILDASRTAAANMATVSIPVAGAVRNWNTNPPDPVTIVSLDPSKRYTVAELSRAFEKGGAT
jgi:hypothetical protein